MKRLPAISETARTYLFADRVRMMDEGLPSPTIDRVIRLRDLYCIWLETPSLKEKEIVAMLKERGLKTTQAYDDLGVLKQLLGTMQKETKDYQRLRAKQMIEESYEMAKKKKDVRSMVAAAKAYADAFDVKNDEDRTDLFAEIIPATFKFTDDPRVAGFEPIPNAREKIRKKIAQYWSEDVEDITFDEIDYNEEEIFNPKKNAGASTDIP